jgi:hypothetical protein
MSAENHFILPEIIDFEVRHERRNENAHRQTFLVTVGDETPTD